jgi:hypothetical protein
MTLNTREEGEAAVCEMWRVFRQLSGDLAEQQSRLRSMHVEVVRFEAAVKTLPRAKP